MRTKLYAARYIPTGSTAIEYEDIPAVVYVHEYDNGSGVSRVHALGYSYKRNKPDWNYNFKTREQMDHYAAAWVQNLRDVKAMKEGFKAKRKAARSLPNPFKVGDILHYSWGYDQTNCEFYQVIEVRERSVVIREIGHKPVEGSQGFMSQSVKPDKDRFLSPRCDGDDQGKPLTKVVQWATWNEEPYAYLSMDYGSATLVNEDSKHYSSWYA